MSNLMEHAKIELEAAGWFQQLGGMYGGAVGVAVMELIKVFADQDHSGMSAGIVRSLFNALANYEPLGPLTGVDSEWVEVAEENDEPLYQNIRCHRVFKRGDEAYDIDGRVFEVRGSGVRYTSRDSHVPVTFPYVPKTEIVLVDS